jgi:hypothetical protein
MINKFFTYTILAVLFLIGCMRNKEAIPDKITYNNHIRPILSDKCFKCHGPDEKKRISGYRLDTPEGAYALLKDQKNKFGIVKGHAEQSDVYSRIMSNDPDYVMPTPESNLTLTQKEKDMIKQWINQGAEYEKHWSFIPLKPTKVPEINNEDWSKNPIDKFIYAKMDEQGLEPSEEEEKELLLKRMMHDITGLPPSIEEQELFINEKSENNYDKAVDKALASKHYGEKMAVMWMDISRFADSHGYQDDGKRTMWPWRDWVIHSFNQNYSYKKFITWQLAGDLLGADTTKESIIATGFNRNHKITQEGGVIDEEYRLDYVTDRNNTFGKAVLGLTLECCKCHDHKYDPISQNDYFSSFAFFNQVPEKGMAGDIFVSSYADYPNLTITSEERKGMLSFINNLDTSPVKVMVMRDLEVKRPTHILLRGQYDQLGDIVQPSMPKAIMNFDTTKYRQNRFGLTQWLFDEQNPLTSRVFVNLIWQEFFGKGIVRSSGDFGLQGDLPSHPELLDWLAYDFMKNGWDVKRLIKQIVTSQTYKQSGKTNESKLKIDPENVFLSSGPRIKLSAEMQRDHVLAASGILNRTIGGASVKNYQPPGLWEAATSGRGELASFSNDHGDDLYRRGLYQFIKRTVPPPSLLIMDGTNRDQCEVKRSNTSTPLQALVMMNDIVVNEASRFFAQKLLKQKSSTEQNINHAFRSILCRNPEDSEIQKIKNYHDVTMKSMTKEKAEKILDVGEYENPKSDKVIEIASMMQTINLMFNLEEATTR